MSCVGLCKQACSERSQLGIIALFFMVLISYLLQTMIENNSQPAAIPPGASLGLGTAPTLPSGIVPPHMLLSRERGLDQQSGPAGRAPMKEYMDRVIDKKKWEDVSTLLDMKKILMISMRKDSDSTDIYNKTTGE